jgi:hypothetical protein
MRIDTYGDTELNGYTDFTDTTAIKVPVGTTAERPGESGQRVPVTTGQVRFNSSDVAFEGYDGTAWATLGGVKDIDQDTFIRAETASGDDNDQLDFFTANVQRMQIGATGNLAFGDGLDKFTVAFTTGTANFAGDLVVEGDLTINGTTTTLDTTTLIVEDKNIELGNVASPTDITANGGGITLLGDTNKTMLYNVTNAAWQFSENVNIANAKVYRINNSDVLSATTLGSGVVASSLTSVGQLAAGSITTSFGDINIGASTFTGNGSGLTTLNASELDSGTVDGARLGGNQSMAGVKTFTDTSAATNTTTGAVRVGGGLGVAGDVYAGSLNTSNGSGIQALNATNLGSGTVPNARITGTYSNLTGSGALDAGQITSGFGNVNIGTSTFTGNGSGLTDVDAETLDGINGASFLRSDEADTMTALLTMSHAGDEMIRLADTSASGSPYISFYQATDRRGYIQYADSGDKIQIVNEGGNTRLEIDNGSTGLKFNDGANTYTVWHAGNDGAGSGLNADELDGLSSGSFIRSDANDSFSGTITGAGTINITGNITANSFTGDGSGLTGISADDANTLDGLDSTAFLRTNGAHTSTATQIFSNSGTAFRGTQGTMGDNDQWRFGGAATGSNAGYLEVATGDDGTEPHYHRQYTGVFSSLTRTATILNGSGNTLFPGEVTAYSSDARLKTNVENIPNALDKVKALNGVLYNWTAEGHKWGLDVDTEKREVGLLAQEVQAVLPEAVAPAPFDLDDDGNSRSGEDYLTVKYERIAPVLIEAIKEQQKEIDELKAMVQKLLDK